MTNQPCQNFQVDKTITDYNTWFKVSGTNIRYDDNTVDVEHIIEVQTFGLFFQAAQLGRTALRHTTQPLQTCDFFDDGLKDGMMFRIPTVRGQIGLAVPHERFYQLLGSPNLTGRFWLLQTSLNKMKADVRPFLTRLTSLIN